MTFILRKTKQNGHGIIMISAPNAEIARIVKSFDLFRNEVLSRKLLLYIETILPENVIEFEDIMTKEIQVINQNTISILVHFYNRNFDIQDSNDLARIMFEDTEELNRIVDAISQKIIFIFNSILELYSLGSYIMSKEENRYGEIDRNDPISTGLIIHSNARVVEIARILGIPPVPPGTVQNISNVYRILKLGLADPRIPL